MQSKIRKQNKHYLPASWQILEQNWNRGAINCYSPFLLMNYGKRFENNFKSSIPSSVYLYRLKDGSSSWGGNEKVRFQPKNVCDFIMYSYPFLFMLELKSTKSKSLPLSNIKENQIKGLNEAVKYNGIISGLLIEFREPEKVYFLDINTLIIFLNRSQRKSIPISFLEKEGIEIETMKKKINYKFNVEKMIKDVINGRK